MSFEERLLMELKAEVAARGVEHRRRVTVRRLFAGAAVAGLAAAAAVAVPLLTGTESPAYAVTKNTDGTIGIEIKEFRDADKLEKDLARLGVTADVTYVKPGTWCRRDRGRVVPGDKAAHVRAGGVDIEPRYIAKGQTLLLEFTMNEEQTSGPVKPQVLWQFSGRVIDGPVKPCVVVQDPSWNDIGGPEGRPPAGS
ncbi:hypothetical protein [Nonomuraea sp. NPDC005501]|uniref:hypothetical protein n=1 Tax=Nonomuraea sp. NPDC005501 TaxID=3156884 RepID=UPI0033B8BBDF